MAYNLQSRIAEEKLRALLGHLSHTGTVYGQENVIASGSGIVEVMCDLDLGTYEIRDWDISIEIEGKNMMEEITSYVRKTYPEATIIFIKIDAKSTARIKSYTAETGYLLEMKDYTYLKARATVEGLVTIYDGGPNPGDPTQIYVNVEVK